MISDVDFDTKISLPSAVPGSKFPWTSTSTGGLRLQCDGSSVIIHQNKWQLGFWSISIFFDGEKPIFFPSKFETREEAAQAYEATREKRNDTFQSGR